MKEEILDTSQASREILWNISVPDQIIMYAVFALSLVICLNGIFWRMRMWLKGKPQAFPFAKLGERCSHFFADTFLQRRVIKKTTSDKRAPGIFHTLIFYGFLVLLFTTTMVFIDHDLGIKIYRGNFYLVVTVLSDLFGLALLLAVIYAFHRRAVKKPDLLHSTASDYFALILLGGLCLQGFILEGLRIKAVGDPWALYSPVGLVFAKFFWGVSDSSAKFIHYIIWWIHALCVFGFIALIPYSKLFHILASSANLFFRSFHKPKGALSYPGNIESLMESALSDEGEFSIGITGINDLTWKQRLELDACTSCGRCQEVCPAYNSGKPLSPKWLILDTRNHFYSLRAKDSFLAETIFSPILRLLSSIDARLLKFAYLDKLIPDKKIRGKNTEVQNALLSLGTSDSDKLAGTVMNENVFWACTTCRACMEVCPVGIEHVDLIVETRRALTLMEGSLPQEAASSLRAIESKGNPFGPESERSEWAKGLDIKFLTAGDKVDILYWVGCISSYDKRKQSIVRAMVKVLNASGLSWGILGNKERCTGDPARRLGEENLFQQSAKCNIEVLKSVSFSRIVANCPHCFNTLGNEYSDVDAAFTPEVIHHSELIQELIADKKITLRNTLSEEVTFHDPCYLGRYNNRYTEPRDVLVQLGRPVKEMRDNKERGMCCGAGGGHFFMDMKIGERVNVLRLEQALETETKTIATACPFCMHMLEDGAKLKDVENRIEVKDIAELVAENLA